MTGMTWKNIVHFVRMTRSVDIVLWGCTGFTGGLVAEYFATSVSADIKWAIAGRTASKLKALKDRLTRINSQCENLEIIHADIGDTESLRRMARQSKVVLSTAGPFINCGTPLVRACVEEGTHYCDTTGEVPWVRQLIDEFHDAAEQKGVHVVPCCGFDSIPFDLGVFMMAQDAKKYGGMRWLKGFARWNGQPSGGTVHTILNLLETVPVSKMQDMHLLDPVSHRKEPLPKNCGEQKFPCYNKTLKTWTAPFMMSGANIRVVRRSALLYQDAGEAYGPPEEFAYTETEAHKNALSAYMTTCMLGVFALMAFFSFTRSLLKRIVPSPGTGPSQEVRDKSWFQVQFAGEGVDGTSLRGTVAGGDPGYTETAKMVSNAALCLVDTTQLPAAGGVLTPARSMGSTLIERLQEAGLIFETDPPHAQ